MNKTVYFGLLFVFLVFLQVFVLNNILFLGYVNPYLYISFVFLYPLKKNRFVFLLLSFALGVSIDFFSDSGGIHAFSLVTISYLRLFFIRVFFNKFEVDYPFFKLNLVAVTTTSFNNSTFFFCAIFFCAKRLVLTKLHANTLTINNCLFIF